MRTVIRVLMVLATILVLGGCEGSEVDGVSVTYSMPDGRQLSATYKRAASSENVPILLLLHQPGVTNDRNDFDDLWEPLLGLGYGLLAPDLASHGYSDSAGSWEELQTDPTVWPADVLAWLQWIEDNQDEEPFVRNAVGVIGLGTSGSLAAAAIGKGQVDCVVAVSASIDELNALHPGFPVYVPPGDDDDSASEARDDDDDSAADDDDSAADDDDSAADDDDVAPDDDDSAVDDDDVAPDDDDVAPDDDDVAPDDDDSAPDDDDVAPDDDDSAADDDDGVDSELDMHTVRWLVGTGDDPPAADAQALFDATSGDRDLLEVDGAHHGIEIIWLSDETKDAMILWCGDKF
jgi:hypothetical protein